MKYQIYIEISTHETKKQKKNLQLLIGRDTWEYEFFFCQSQRKHEIIFSNN